MNEKYIDISFQLISIGGDAKSLALMAIESAKNGDFKTADAQLKEAQNTLTQAHKNHVELIQSEAKGEKIEMSLLLVHSQNHLSMAITVLDLAGAIIELFRRK